MSDTIKQSFNRSPFTLCQTPMPYAVVSQNHNPHPPICVLLFINIPIKQQEGVTMGSHKDNIQKLNFSCELTLTHGIL